MEKRIFRIVSVCAIMAMLVAMIVITSISVSAFDPLDGDESTGGKTTIGPLDSREEGVSQTISYPEDYYSAVTYGPLDGEESEEESDVPTDPSQSVTDPSQSVTDPSQSVTDPSQSVTDPSQSATEPSQSATDPSQSATDPSQSATEPSQSVTAPSQSATGSEPIVTLPTMPTMPTMPSQSGTSETEPSVSEKTPLYGDANDDGAVNMKDVLLMRKYVAELPVTVNMTNADVDVSGALNMKDILSVRKFIAELVDHLGPTA